jgi:1,4-dihydroxy-2-naphthoyl-CoA hydrolase
MAIDEPQLLADAMPFARACGVEIEHAGPQEVRGTLGWDPDRCTVGGVLHGGALMTLADSVGAVCAFLNLPAGAQTSTISSSTSFLRAVRGGRVTAVSRPLHVGRSVIVVRSEGLDDDGRLVAHMVQHQAVHDHG